MVFWYTYDDIDYHTQQLYENVMEIYITNIHELSFHYKLKFPFLFLYLKPGYLLIYSLYWVIKIHVIKRFYYTYMNFAFMFDNCLFFFYIFYSDFWCFIQYLVRYSCYANYYNNKQFAHFLLDSRGRHDRHRMVVGFTTTSAISAHHH